MGSSGGDGALNLRLKLMLDTPFSSIPLPLFLPLFLAPNNPDYRLENPPLQPIVTGLSLVERI